MPVVGKPTPPRARRFIEQMTPGEQFEDQAFLVFKKDLRTASNGSLYIHVVLMDRTGQLLGRIWSATQEMYDLIPDGGFIRVRGRTESYKGNLQFIIDGLRPAAADQVDLADFVPRTKHDIDAMWQRVAAILKTVAHPQLTVLLDQFLKDETLIARFKQAPAAVQLHHAYIGGLLEHTLSVLEIATRLFGAKDASDSHYPWVSRDLVLVGIFLHDIGKTQELTYQTSFAYSNAGQLVGHITQAAILIDQKVGDVEQATGTPFPADLQQLLTHIVLAHHGSYEFGSPRLPACPEAIVVHYLDNIDAKLQMFLTAITDAKNPENDWSEYVQPLTTRVFKRDVMGVRVKKKE